MKTKSAVAVKSEEVPEAFAVAAEPATRTGEWTLLVGHQPQDQLNIRQSAVTIFAELRQQEGRWHLTRLG